MLHRYSFDSPVGCLRLEEEDGYLTGLHFDPDPSVRYADDTDLLRQTQQQLTEYFAGQSHQLFDSTEIAGDRLSKAGLEGAANHSLCKDDELWTRLQHWQEIRKPVVRSGWQTIAIRLPSLCPVIGSSVQTAEWSATAADCGSRKSC